MQCTSCRPVKGKKSHKTNQDNVQRLLWEMLPLQTTHSAPGFYVLLPALRFFLHLRIASALGHAVFLSNETPQQQIIAENSVIINNYHQNEALRPCTSVLNFLLQDALSPVSCS